MDCIVNAYDSRGRRVVSYRVDLPTYSNLLTRLEDIGAYIPSAVRVTVDLALDPDRA